MMNTCFSDAKQIPKCPETVLCEECTYVQEDINESDDSFLYQPDNEPTFSSSFSGGTYS